MESIFSISQQHPTADGTNKLRERGEKKKNISPFTIMTVKVPEQLFLWMSLHSFCDCLGTKRGSVNLSHEQVNNPRNSSWEQEGNVKGTGVAFFFLSFFLSRSHSQNINSKHACKTMHTHKHTHAGTLTFPRCIVTTLRSHRSWGIDKSLRPESGAEVGLIEMNFRKGGTPN